MTPIDIFWILGFLTMSAFVYMGEKWAQKEYNNSWSFNGIALIIIFITLAALPLFSPI